MSEVKTPFEKWWSQCDYWDTSDPGMALAQRAWNAAIQEAASEVSNRYERILLLTLMVHEKDLIR